MNGRTASLINTVAAKLAPAYRRRLKRLWTSAPSPERGRLRRGLQRAMRLAPGDQDGAQMVVMALLGSKQP